MSRDPSLTNDLSCGVLWPLRSGLMTSILIIQSPCCKDGLQIVSGAPHCTESVSGVNGMCGVLLITPMTDLN